MNPALTIAAEAVLLLLLAVGCAVTLLGSLALVKLPDFFQRLHGPTKNSTLGVGCILIASVLHHALIGNGLHPRELLITLFLFMTAPISAYMMARAAFSMMQRNGDHAQLPPPPPGHDGGDITGGPSTDPVPNAAAAEPDNRPGAALERSTRPDAAEVTDVPPDPRRS